MVVIDFLLDSTSVPTGFIIQDSVTHDVFFSCSAIRNLGGGTIPCYPGFFSMLPNGDPVIGAYVVTFQFQGVSYTTTSDNISQFFGNGVSDFADDFSPFLQNLYGYF